MKKLIAILTVFAMLFAFASCKDDSSKNTEQLTEIVTDSQGETVTNEHGNAVTEIVTAVESTADVTNAEESNATEATTLPELSTVSSDPTNWSAEEIVAFYKNAAIRSKTKVKSTEYKNLDEMVVNDGDGLLGTLVEWATPFLVSALEDSQVEFDGITGGYENLTASDAKSVKAYKSGEYTVVEMKMKEQTDGIHGERYSGTVGHAISVVGDISSVEEALPMFAIDFENADIKLHYKEPTLKVKINKDGIIEKGTWSYTIKIDVANLHVAAVRLPIEAMVESAYGSVGYVITVGGGF